MAGTVNQAKVVALRIEKKVNLFKMLLSDGKGSNQSSNYFARSCGKFVQWPWVQFPPGASYPQDGVLKQVPQAGAALLFFLSKIKVYLCTLEQSKLEKHSYGSKKVLEKAGL